MTKTQQRSEQVPLFPLGPLPRHSVTTQLHGLPHPGEHLRLCPLLHNKRAETKKMAQMKELIKAPEKIPVSDEVIAKLSDAQFKTLVIRKKRKK